MWSAVSTTKSRPKILVEYAWLEKKYTSMHAFRLDRSRLDGAINLCARVRVCVCYCFGVCVHCGKKLFVWRWWEPAFSFYDLVLFLWPGVPPHLFNVFVSWGTLVRLCPHEHTTCFPYSLKDYTLAMRFSDNSQVRNFYYNYSQVLQFLFYSQADKTKFRQIYNPNCFFPCNLSFDSKRVLPGPPKM